MTNFFMVRGLAESVPGGEENQCVSLHRPGPPPRWDPWGRPPRPLLCHLGHTTLDDGLELHVVVDVGAGGGGLHRLQPGLVHWGRGPGGCRVGVQPAGGPPPAPPHTHQSPRQPHRLLPGAAPAAGGRCPLGMGTVLEGWGRGAAVLAALAQGPSSHLTAIRPQAAAAGSLGLAFRICRVLSPPLSLRLVFFFSVSLI